MDLTYFGTQKIILFLLILIRTAGIFTLTPIFGGNQTPMQVKLATALALTIVFLPLAKPPAELPDGVFGLGLVAGREALVGLAIGFVVNMIFSAIETAGHIVDVNAGFALATVVDPVNGQNSALAARMHSLLAGLLFFATNSHHLLLKGLADSFNIAPVGQIAMTTAVAGGIFELFSMLFMVAVRIAAPVIAAVFLADLALAIAARVVPQMNVLIVGFPLKLGVGIAGMIVALPVIAAGCTGLFGDTYGQITSVLRLMVIR